MLSIITVLLMANGFVHAAGLVVNLVGDIMLGGRYETELSGNRYLYPFEKLAAELQAADITLANLEAPLTSRGEEFTNKKFRFRVRPEAAAGLKKAGITTVSLANNHIMDYGAVGLADTIAALEKAGIGHIGAGANLAEARKGLIYDIRGIKVALLGYSLTLPQEFWATAKAAGTAPLLEKFVKGDVAAARKQADVVIVAVHWGEEGKRSLREYQPRLGRMMIDAGADLVVGHHPHVLQGVEQYKRGIIFYSLGNFLFASKSRVADRSMLVQVRFDGDKRTAEFLPLNIRHSEVGFQPALLSGKGGERVIKELERFPPGRLRVKQVDGRYLVDF